MMLNAINLAFLTRSHVFRRKLLNKYSCCVISSNKNFSISGNNFKDSLSIDVSYSQFKPEKEILSPVPLIILHGFLGSKLNWRSLGKAIATNSRRHVYTLDARNHGDSPHTDDFSIALMSEDLKHFMHKENIPEAILVGHSMGGRTAIYFTLTNKELVKKLVVVDISPNTLPLHSSLSPTYMKLMKEAVSAVLGLSLNKARKAIDEYLSKDIPESTVRQFLLTNLTEKDQKVVWKPNLDALLNHFKTGVLEMPTTSGFYMGETLFICGENSQFVQPEDYPKIKSLFPKADIKTIAGAGHWVHSEKPSEFIKTLCDFL